MDFHSPKFPIWTHSTSKFENLGTGLGPSLKGDDNQGLIFLSSDRLKWINPRHIIKYKSFLSGKIPEIGMLRLFEEYTKRRKVDRFLSTGV